MDAVIAGWVAGYAMALVSTAALTYLLVDLRNTEFMERVVAREVPGALLAVPISIGMVVGWTMLGLLAGIVFSVGDLGGTRDGLGSPALGFTVAILALAAAPAVVLIVLWPRRWWLWFLLSASFAGAFGWLMPLLAAR